MDKQQYEVMTQIMKESRDFANRMFILMSKYGLFDQKYQLSLEVGNHIRNPITGWESSIELAKDIRDFYKEPGDDTRGYYRTRMLHVRKGKEGWEIYSDPQFKSGTIQEDDGIPQDTDICGAESGTYPAGEASEQNAPSGNGSLWFRDDDGDPPMVCRGDLKEVE